MRDVEKILLFSASEKCTQEGNLFPRRSIAGICAHLLPAIAWACEELASVQTTLQRWGISLETSVWAVYLPAFPQTALLQAIPQCPVSSPPRANTLTDSLDKSGTPEPVPDTWWLLFVARGNFLPLVLQMLCAGSHSTHIYIHTTNTKPLEYTMCSM